MALQTRSKVSSSRSVALIGLFSALYIVSSGIVSYITQLGYPEHFLRGILMTGVIVTTGRKWGATMMGVVCGIVFMFAVASPAPYLLFSTVTSGLVYDLVLMIGSSYASSARSQSRILTGAAVSGLAESVVALAILTLFVSSRSWTGTLSLGLAWSVDIVLNIILSSIGALIAFRFLSRKVISAEQNTQTPSWPATGPTP